MAQIIHPFFISGIFWRKLHMPTGPTANVNDQRTGPLDLNCILLRYNYLTNPQNHIEEIKHPDTPTSSLIPCFVIMCPEYKHSLLYKLQLSI